MSELERTHSLQRKIIANVAMMLQNPQCQCIVVDRQPGESPFVMCFDVRWNDVVKKTKSGHSLALHLLAGGPIE
jgi:hypothetical protein